jgi:hypothetical protein
VYNGIRAFRLPISAINLPSHANSFLYDGNTAHREKWPAQTPHGTGRSFVITNGGTDRIPENGLSRV